MNAELAEEIANKEKMLAAYQNAIDEIRMFAHCYIPFYFC